MTAISRDREQVVDRFPPGPRWMPLIVARYLRDPCGFYARCVRLYGDPFLMPTPFGPLVVTGRPEGIETIFAADPDTFDIFAQSSVQPFLGASSLMLSTGGSHLRMRRLLMPRFHGRQVVQFSSTMQAIATEAAAGWPMGQPFVAQEAMQALSFEIILRVFFGAKEHRKALLRTSLHAVQQTTSPAITFVSMLRHQFGGFGPWAKFCRAMKRLDDTVYSLIAEARHTSSEDDILGLLLSVRHEDGSGLSDLEIRDQLVSLVAAGHETLASALAWALYWLHRHPEVLTHLCDELTTVEDDAEFKQLMTLPYLDAVCNETLRLSPILPEVPRLLRRPFQFLGYSLPAGYGVASIASLVHMREDLYPAAGEFQPQRFLQRKYSPFEFVPFGGGTHRCLGATFAFYEMKVVLAALLRHCRFSIHAATAVRPRRQQSFPFGPHGAFKLVLESRRIPPSRYDPATSESRPSQG